MSAVADSARVLRHATGLAISELGAMYTWQSWLFGWVLRVLAQIILYTLIGVLLDDPATIQFLFIGNVALIAGSAGMFAIASTQWERAAGTLPLLVAAPSRIMWVYLGRSVEWLADGLATSTLGLLIVGPMFGINLTAVQIAQVIPLLLMVVTTTYGMGTFLGAVALRNPDIRNVVLNVSTGTMAIVTGANFPVEFLPVPLQWFSQIFPLTHGLRAIRELISGAGWTSIAPDIALCILVGLIWMAIAAATFELFAESGRKDGSIEFGT